MAEVQVKVFRVKFKDWNGVERTQTQMPQNWSNRAYGVLNADNLKKFLEGQWKGNGAVVHSVEKLDAVAEAEKFALPSMPANLSAENLARMPAGRLTAEARPTIIGKP